MWLMFVLARTFRQSVMPSISGIITSLIRRWTGLCSKKSYASAPLPHTSTLYSFDNSFRRYSRISFSSSTMSTCGLDFVFCFLPISGLAASDSSSSLSVLLFPLAGMTILAFWLIESEVSSSSIRKWFYPRSGWQALGRGLTSWNGLAI